METKNTAEKAVEKKPIPLKSCIFTFVFLLVAILIITIPLGANIAIALMVGSLAAILVAIRAGYSWNELIDNITEAVKTVAIAFLIMFVIGMVISEWMLGGIIPSMIYYGLQILSPKIFMVATMIICAIFSMSTGSSWSTVGTVGIALFGVGAGLGMPPAMTAGAIISGAYFGDKLSPLSDSTILTATAAGISVFEHMRHMMHTAVPSYIISMGVMAVISNRYIQTSGGVADTTTVDLYCETIASTYHVSLLNLLPIFVVILVIIFKIPTLPGLLLVAVTGAVYAAVFQGASLIQIINVAYSGMGSIGISTGVDVIDSLLKRGGISSMLGSTVTLISCITYAGIMQSGNMLKTIVDTLMKYAKRDRDVVLFTMLTSVMFLLSTGATHANHILIGTMYKDYYKERGIALRNLSRASEDMGTSIQALIPYTSSTIYIVGALGVAMAAYAPYAVWLYIHPVVAFACCLLGIDIPKQEYPETKPEYLEEIRSGKVRVVKSN